MDILEKLLHDLQSSVDGEGDSDNFDSNNLVSNIEICLQGLEADDMDAGISLLLTSQVPQNIFFYFDKTIRTKDRDVIKSKISAFKLISSLVKQVAGINANEHISVILDGCLNIFSRENSNEVKSNCLGPVKNILRDLDAYPDVFAEHSPPASAFYETFTKELLTNRQAKGLRAELITTLGLLMRRIQASVDSDSGHLMEWTTAVCDRAYEMLSSNIIGNKDPDLPQMSGALSALDRCLSISISGSVNVSELWKMVLQVTSSLSNNTLTRYSHIRKALRLVCNHGALFVKVVGLNAQQAYNVFIACLQADKDTLKKYAERAVLVVLADMAQYACFAAASSVLGNAGEYTDVCMKTVMALSSKYILSLNSLGTRKAEYDIAGKVMF